MFIKAFASGGVGKKVSASKKSTKPTSTKTRGKTSGASNTTRGRSASNKLFNEYKRKWNNNEIGIRTLTQSMQADGFSTKQISSITRFT